MMRNMPEFLRVEIGFIIISPVAQRIGVATEMIYLMASQCFGIGYNRLEWKCDNLNERSKGTALANGFTFEGIQQYHMIVKGRNRDTAWFRMLKREWDQIKGKIEEKMNGRN